MSTPSSCNPTEVSSEGKPRDGVGSPSSWRNLLRGWRPYMALLAGHCGMMNSWGLITSYGTFYRYYDEILLLSHPSPTISVIGSISAFFILALSFTTGRLLDAQYHRWTTGIGGVLVTLAYLGLSFCGGNGGENQGVYWGILLCQGVFAGVGKAAFFVHSSQTAVQHFPNHYQLAVGVTSTGAAVGGLMYPLVITSLLKKFSFAIGIKILTGIIGFLCLITFAFGGPVSGAPQRPLERKLSSWIDLSAFKCRTFTLLATATALIFFGVSPLLFNVTEWAEQDKLNTAFFLSFMNAASVVGRLGTPCLTNFKSRWSNPLLVQGVGTIVAAIAVLLFWPLAAKQPDAIAFSVVFGMLIGAMIGLPASGVAYIMPEKSKGKLGIWTGMMWTSCAPFALAGPPLVGLAKKKDGIWVIGYWTGSVLIVAAALLLVALVLKLRDDSGKGRGNKEERGEESEET